MSIGLREGWLSVVLLAIAGCGQAASGGVGAAEQAGGAGGADTRDLGHGGGGAGNAGEAGANRGCEGEPLECEDCPTLEDFRDSCADAFRTTCGGTLVGPLRADAEAYTYCYGADGALIGSIVEDTDSPSNRQVLGLDCAALGESQSLCDADGPASLLAPDSESIEIGWFSFFDGGYRFKRRLDQLSPQQLALAQAIQIVPPTGACWQDAAEMSVTVTAGDMVRELRANEYNGTCGRDVTLVDFEAVSALLDTVQCLPAKGYEHDTPEAAPSITPDDGCWHGLFNAHGSSPEWWFRTEIPDAGEYRIALEACGDRRLELELFEQDATTSVATATGTGECPVLAHTFAAGGSYALRVRMVGGSYAGDFFLSLESRP
ncbi:MAG TPA: hypothetical protein VHP33_08570 [Polyangiaceae bacterium]|nr:hypothetical protein [Polyangiaceae bacterium]